MSQETVPRANESLETENPQDEATRQLAMLNANIERQMSLGYILRNGIFHGIGFMIGSTLLTAAVVSIILQFFSNTIFGDVISWIARVGR